MTGPYVMTTTDLQWQVRLNRGWMFVHTGDFRNPGHERAARAFEAARWVLEDRSSVTLLRLQLGLEESDPFGLDPAGSGTVRVYHDSDLLESGAAPTTPGEWQEMVDFMISFHASDPAR